MSFRAEKEIQRLVKSNGKCDTICYQMCLLRQYYISPLHWTQ